MDTKNLNVSRESFKNKVDKLIQQIEDIGHADASQVDIKRENANIDGNCAMGTMLQFGSAVSKHFAQNYLMSPEFVELHNNGDIHIHDMDFLAMGTTTCTQIDLAKLFKDGYSTGHGHLRQPKGIMSYAALAAIAIQSNQNDQHGGQSIPMFDYYMAPGVLETFKKELKIRLQEYGEANHISFNLDAINSITTIDFTSQWQRYVDILFPYVETDSKRSSMIRIIENALRATEKATYQAMEGFVHNLNTMHSRAGAQVPFSSINLGTDITPEGRMVIRNYLLAHKAGLGNGETPVFPIVIFKVKEGINYNPGDPNYDLLKLACETTAKRMFPNFSFLDAPFNKEFLQEGRPETEVAYMGCRTRVLADVNGEAISPGRGNLSFTTINLPRIALETEERGEFYDVLSKRLEQVKAQLLERFEIQKRKSVVNFPFVLGQDVWIDSDKVTDGDLYETLKHGTLSIGFIGLAETLKILTGKNHGEDEEVQKLGLLIIDKMRKKVDQFKEETGLNFTLLATPAEGLSGRFTNIDRNKFGIIENVTDREFYTNSFHIPVYQNISIKNKIELEAPYHKYTNAGHITYVELDGDTADNIPAVMGIVRLMKESGIGYGAINHPVDRDPICGYNGVIKDTCPGCGRLENGHPFERIRRITGYLVGTLDRFNNAKRAEEQARVKHDMELGMALASKLNTKVPNTTKVI